jgi:hypothetical protein
MSRLHYARRRVRDMLIANGAVEAPEEPLANPNPGDPE